MLRKSVLFFVLFLMSVIFTKKIYADEMYFELEHRDFIFDRKLKKSFPLGEGLNREKIGEDLTYFCSYAKDRHLISGNQHEAYSVEYELKNYIIDMLNLDERKIPIFMFPLNKKIIFQMKPILDEHSKVKDILFSIEYQQRVENDLGEGHNGVFSIEHFVLTLDELKYAKEFSYTKNNIHIDELVNEREKLKIITYEQPDKVGYIEFDFKIYKKSINDNSMSNLAPIEPEPKDKTVIKAPYRYDIKYSNSEGQELVIEKVVQEEEFIFQIKTQEIIDPVSFEKEFVKTILRGQIYPLKMHNGELEVQVAIWGGVRRYDAMGKGKAFGGGTFHKEFTLTSKDVVEIKCPKNWPKSFSGQQYNPVTLKKEAQFFASTGIKNQSIFLKPVIIKE